MNGVTAPPPLWRQLQLAAGVVASVRQGVSGTAALEGVESALRPGVQALVFHVLRHLGLAEALSAQLAKRPPPPEGDALLCTALALAAPDADARGMVYEAFTLVDQAVEAAKRNLRTRSQANFINACLRRFLRERASLMVAVAADPVAAWNHPRWWIDRLRQDWPDDWQAMLRADNARAPMTLRVNLQRGTVAERQAALARAGLAAQAVGTQGLMLDQARPVSDIPGFAEGALSVQDAAAQWAAPLLLAGLDLSRPLRVLDACAAPGGKTAHLLELLADPVHGCADSRVVALEIDPGRCQKIRDTLRREGLEAQAQILVADAGRPADWQHTPGAE
ncbi:MAG: 16S rRNA (cytosine(967)-C(5))-methyltransferase RsmB, partial [Burkholderiaceae bacterium]|nr:16S rRNA (cytosine(967)-C(5))-methyltransferase RsmB [Burkholderiaceae bacterium]